MTAITSSFEDWTESSLGKATRIGIGVLGVLTATLTLILAAVMQTGVWATVLAGVALAATSSRAAKDPSVIRLTAVTANLILIPLLMRLG